MEKRYLDQKVSIKLIVYPFVVQKLGTVSDHINGQQNVYIKKYMSKMFLKSS